MTAGNAFDKDTDCDAVNALPESLFDTGGALANMDCARPVSLNDADPVDDQYISEMHEVCNKSSSKLWLWLTLGLGIPALAAMGYFVHNKLKRGDKFRRIAPDSNGSVELATLSTPPTTGLKLTF